MCCDERQFVDEIVNRFSSNLIGSIFSEFRPKKKNSNEEQEIDQRVVKINVSCNENRVIILSRHGEFLDEKNVTAVVYLGHKAEG